MNGNYLKIGIFLLATVLLNSCTEEHLQNSLTKEQKELIGHAIHFEPSVEDLVTTRSAYSDGFNDGDVMFIYRQGSNAEGIYVSEEPWVQYKLKAVFNYSGSLLSSVWYVNTITGGGYRGRTQTNADSLSWENGLPTRFRAWAKSSISNYQDYMYADFATTAGPVASVPLVFKHLGCRVGFYPIGGNEITSVSICTDAADYLTVEGGKTAEEQAAAVADVYNKMCTPYGVQIYTNADYNGYEPGTTTPVSSPEVQDGSLVAMPSSGTTPVLGKIATADNTKRPDWTSNLWGYRYMVSIPYEMNSENYGNAIILPPFTRFRISFYDVNGESVSCVFSLSDAKVNNVARYPDGLTLRAGYSYAFIIGYNLKQLTVTPSDDFSWNNSPTNATITDETSSTEADYEWWKNSMNAAAATALTNNAKGINPSFTISTVAQWKALVNLVSGKDLNINYDKYIPLNGTDKAKIEQATQTASFDFSGYKITVANDIDFEDIPMGSIGTSEYPFKGTFDGGLHKFSNCNFSANANQAIFGMTDGAVIQGIYLDCMRKTTLISSGTNTTIRGIYLTGPSNNAIANSLTNCKVMACAHVGKGTGNGPLVGTGINDTSLAGCFIAANSAYLYGSGCSCKCCYYDKSFYSSAVDGSDESSSVFKQYIVRGVPSSVLKAKYDAVASKELKASDNYSIILYYGLAPWKALNSGGLSYYHFEVANYDDQYPVLVSGTPDSNQSISSLNDEDNWSNY